MNSVSAALVNERCFATAWNTCRRRSAMSLSRYTERLFKHETRGGGNRAALEPLLRQTVPQIERALGLLGGRLALEGLPVPAVDFLITGSFGVEPILGFRPRRDHRRSAHPTR